MSLFSGSNTDKKHIESFFSTCALRTYFITTWIWIYQKKYTTYTKFYKCFFLSSVHFFSLICFISSKKNCGRFFFASLLKSYHVAIFFLYDIKITRILRKAKITGYLCNWCLFFKKNFGPVLYGHILMITTALSHWINHIFSKNNSE